jgi:secondary thiamine-phosphate synthase enzyme
VPELRIETTRRTQLVDVTDLVADAVGGVESGYATIFVAHTTAGVVLQAAGAGAKYVTADLETAFERFVDDAGPWRHSDEGDRNPGAHVRATLTVSSLTIPLSGGRLALGDHQAIFLCEFDGPRERELWVSVR